ncbi:RNA dependent RNA polymerase [Phanerochaete sordida]|uniref:RNA-dependent RNA polymerase n=1 Tax=Phanerochaete sordida TaxID=48140 RepID=A0A9P3G0L6_9APHY|nr:RNA dependent RNA polymerase [Phanerochaete sordida]
MDRQRVVTELKEKTIALRTIQFGWECRDNVFSIEWERVCEAKCELYFHEERREFHIKLYQGSQARIMSIKASNVSWASAGLDKSTQPPLPILFITLNYPPAYESEPCGLERSIEQLVLMAISNNSAGTVLRQRWSHFDIGHIPYAPFVSTAIRLICHDPSDLALFRSLCRHAHMQADDYLYPVEYRDLFAPDVQEAYDAWVRRLPWKVAFQVEALVRGLLVDMKEAMGLHTKISRMVRAKGESHTALFLRHFATQAKTLFWYTDDSRGPTETVDSLFARCEREYMPVQRRRRRGPPVSDVFDCLHVTVTPTTHHLDGPYPERSNRVMRMYPNNHDCFVRVNFVDETDLQLRFDREVDGRAFTKRRVGTVLADGIHIAGRRFEFLAYSQSALKEHAVWFMKEFTLPDGTVVNPSTIISGLGEFNHDGQLIYCPARYGARISQAFTATDSSILVEPEEVFEDDDIKTSDGAWCFTDGVGTMSKDLARAIWKVLAARRRGSRWQTYPRALQIRFRGSKGMLSVDHRLPGRQIRLRPSMIKFEGPESLKDIEVARAFNRPGPFYLNRPLIMILEHLGVRYREFEELQDAAVETAQQSVESLEKAARLLETFGLGASFRLTSVFLNLHKLALGPLRHDRFWQKMMDFAINHVLRELKHHARIPVPNAWNLVGVADVHGYLKEGEVFGCIHPTDGTKPIYLTGDTLVTRSPTIHPGDVQVARGIGPPPPGSPFEKESLRNTLVFSTKGPRPLPSYLGGGDLDGDEYRVTMLSSLLPTKTYGPANYTPAVKKLLDRPSTMQDVADFVTEYINSDSLGIIASNWLIIADQSSQGIFDPDCLKLAALHSDAVDYPKSGQPVPLTDMPKLKFKTKPDWSAPETITTNNGKKYYESQRAIGKLFRRIDLPAVEAIRREQKSQRRSLAEGHQAAVEDVIFEFNEETYDEDSSLQVALVDRIAMFIALGRHADDIIAEIWELYLNYVSQLQTICADHTLSHERTAMLTEEEAVVGTIVAKCSQPRRRKDLMSKLREQTTTLVDGIRFDISGEEGTLPERSMERAWVAFRVATMQDEAFGARSFAWIAMGEIFDAIRVIEESEGLF